MLRKQKKTSPFYKIECFRRFIRLIALNALVPKSQKSTSDGQLKIGMIKRGGVGDWIIFAPVLEQFRKSLQGNSVEIVVYSEKRQEDIIALIGLVDRLVTFDRPTRKSIFARLKLLTRVRKENFDVWIDADISRTNIGDAMSLASTAPLRVGYAANSDSPCHAMIEKSAFTHILPDNLGQIHMRERFERLLLFAGNLIKSIHPILGPTDKIRKLSSGLNRFAWNGAYSDYFVIAPGASSPIRTWPAIRFASLIKQILAAYHLRPVLVGTSSDKSVCDEIARLVGRPELINCAGLDSLAQLFERIAGARLLLTNDSGPMHIGKTTGTPTLAIVSGADFTSYAAYPDASINFCIASSHDQSCFNCRWNCIFPSAGKDANKPCLTSVTVEAARGLVDHILSVTEPESQ